MLNISEPAMSALGKPYFEKNLTTLVEMICQRIRKGILPVEAEFASPPALSQRLALLVEDAGRLGIDAADDVLAYCCLVLHRRRETPEWEIWPVISVVLEARTLPAEERLDAVHALLPPHIATAIFKA